METVHILAVSGAVSDVQLLRDLLVEQKGAPIRYYIEASDDGTDALRQMVRNSHDVYVVDHVVPGTTVTGAELVRKAHAGGCQRTTLLWGSLDDEQMEWMCSDAGACGYLHKTFDMHARNLRRLIRTALRYHTELADLQRHLDTVSKEIGHLQTKVRLRG